MRYLKDADAIRAETGTSRRLAGTTKQLARDARTLARPGASHADRQAATARIYGLVERLIHSPLGDRAGRPAVPVLDAALITVPAASKPAQTPHKPAKTASSDAALAARRRQEHDAMWARVMPIYAKGATR